jgi:hypothetical protein
VKSLAFLALLLAPPQEAEGPGDSSRIEAFYAGQFKEALKKATETHRMLLIKGVSVILDEQAAKDLKRGTC